MSYNKTTYTIFKNRKISFEVKENDYKYVKANNNINEYELLLIEHTITTSSLEKLASFIKFDDDLLKNLYPRKDIDILLEKNNDKEIDKICFEKVQKNAFNNNNGTYTIGKDISSFNHSINFNCACVEYYIKHQDLEYTNESINYIYSLKKINFNDELLINYGNKYFNEPEEKIKFNYINSSYLVSNIIKKYIEKEIYKKIAFNHICGYYGIYYNNDNIVITPRSFKTTKGNPYLFIFNKALSMNLKPPLL